MKRGVVGLIVLFSFSFLPAFSATPTKPGSVCSKQGITKNYQGKKYTCIKSGKKLVWNKGVYISKRITQSSSAPTPMPTTSSSSQTKEDPISGDSCLYAGSVWRNAYGVYTCQTASDGKQCWLNNSNVGSKECKSNSTTSSTPSPSPATTSLPVLGSSCNTIRETIQTSYGFMRCDWAGGATSKGYWYRYEINKVSTSKSNNYKTLPLENQPCDNSGDTFDVSGGYLECRWTHGFKLKWIKINQIHQSFENAKSPQGIEVCKLQNADAVAQTGRNAGAGHAGFPMDRKTKNGMDPNGVNNVLLVGVDFPELRGGDEIKSILKSDTEKMLDWYRYFSNGQAIFNVSTVDHWIHSSRSAASYNPTTPIDGLSNNSNRRTADVMQPFVDLISQEVDLRKFKTVYLFFPDGETTFMIDPIVRNEIFNIKEGQTRLNLYGWWHDLEMMGGPRWTFYVHETLHDFDLLLHAPGNGGPYGPSMLGNKSVSKAMNPYEQFLLGWLPENQIYCHDAKTLTKATVSLTPVEREDSQTKMIIIRLTSTKAIVVESHGIDKWSSLGINDNAFPPGFYSVVAYVVDLNKAVAPPVTSDFRSLSNFDYAWAVWQKVDGGKSTRFPYAPVAFNFDIYSTVAVLGDSFLVDGIRIKFVGTGDYETVEISKE